MRRLGWILVSVSAGVSCRGPTAAPSRDAARAAHVAAAIPAQPGTDTPRAPPPEPVLQGPPEAFGDGSLPPSTAVGPEADATRAVLAALRASIGFWRTEHNARDRCPTFDDLRGTPGAAFDPTNMRRDAWGTEFEIQCVGPRVRLRSAGPDRLADTPDDIWSQ